MADTWRQRLERLLIEPYGIETQVLGQHHGERGLLLIEPYGIETWISVDEALPEEDLLIEPYGIEIEARIKFCLSIEPV